MITVHKDDIPKSDYRPFDEGWEAQREQKKMTDNPWGINNWKHYDWEEGWLQAGQSLDQLSSEEVEPDHKH